MLAALVIISLFERAKKDIAMNHPFRPAGAESVCTAMFRALPHLYPRLLRGAANTFIVGLAALSSHPFPAAGHKLRTP
jgi:hypothetical protein